MNWFHLRIVVAVIVFLLFLLASPVLVGSDRSIRPFVRLICGLVALVGCAYPGYVMGYLLLAWLTHDAPTARVVGGLVEGLISGTVGAIVTTMRDSREGGDDLARPAAFVGLLAILAFSIIGIWIWPPIPAP